MFQKAACSVKSVDGNQIWDTKILCVLFGSMLLLRFHILFNILWERILAYFLCHAQSTVITDNLAFKIISPKKWHNFFFRSSGHFPKVLDFKICFLNSILICICFFLSVILHAQSVFSYYCFQRLEKQQN